MVKLERYTADYFRFKKVLDGTVVGAKSRESIARVCRGHALPFATISTDAWSCQTVSCVCCSACQSSDVRISSTGRQAEGSRDSSTSTTNETRTLSRIIFRPNVSLSERPSTLSGAIGMYALDFILFRHDISSPRINSPLTHDDARARAEKMHQHEE